MKDEKNRKWIDKDTAELYFAKAKRLNDDGQMIGERKKLRDELIIQYGITEMEATNILNGNIREYVHKYDIMSGKSKLHDKRNNKRWFIQFKPDHEEFLSELYRDVVGETEEPYLAV